MNEKRFKTAPNRFREGKTHRYVYDEWNDEWYVPCRGLAKPATGTIIDDPTHPVDCKKCPGAGSPP